MKASFIFIAFLISFSSSAETETFNMALSGRFDRDFCTININNPSPSITLDLSEANKIVSPSRGAMYYLYDIDPATSASIDCSPGEYKVYLEERDNLHSYGIFDKSYATEYSRHYVNNVLHSEYSTYHQSHDGYYDSTPSTVLSNFGEVARYEFYFDFVINEKDLDFLGENFVFSTNFNFIIEKM